MDQLFNNREIAVSIWVTVFICWGLTKSSVRISIKHVFSAFFQRAILTILAMMAGYVYLLVFLISDIELWDIGQLKNTIMWFVFVASVELFKANKIHEEDGYFKNSIKGHLTLLSALEFVVAFHSFGLILELIIVPLSTFAVMVLAISETKEEYKPVEKIMTWVFSIIGLFMVGFSLYFIVLHFGEFAQSTTLMDFSIPIILSMLLLPFLYVISLYMNYERILIRVNIYTENKYHRLYAKFKGIKHFKTDTKSLNNWLAFVCVSDFENRKTIDESIRNFESSV
jgi:hypothetical protein